MSSYNRVTLVGKLKDDPVINDANKRCKASFELAVERFYGKDKNPIVDYFNIVCDGKLAEVCVSYLSKGKKVLVDGHIQVRTLNKDGERKWITEIVAENLKFLATTEPSA